MKAVITVLGKDTVGILAKVSATCAQEGINIIEVTQSVMQDLFAMIMLADMGNSKTTVDELTNKLDIVTKDMGMKVHVMHEDIFNSMHKI